MHVSHIGLPFFVVSEVDMCFPHFGQNVTSTIKGYHFTEGKKRVLFFLFLNWQFVDNAKTLGFHYQSTQTYDLAF